MKKAIFILCLSSLYLVSCGGNDTESDDHGHEHGEHDHGDEGHEHGDDHDHDTEHHHDHEQEEFTVEDDSLTNS